MKQDLGDAASGPGSAGVPSETDTAAPSPPIAIAPAHWIPVLPVPGGSFPEVRQRVLLWIIGYGQCNMYEGYMDTDGSWIDPFAGHEVFEKENANCLITHWMHIPPPHKQDTP